MICDQRLYNGLARALVLPFDHRKSLRFTLKLCRCDYPTRTLDCWQRIFRPQMS